MSSSMYLALRGAKLREQELEVTAHNLANATSNGFKESRITFDTVLTGAERRVDGGVRPSILQPEAKTTINFADGPIQPTDNELDLALQGKGFFEIQTEQGNFYTRDGSFALNDSGDLVSIHGGGRVAGANGTINIAESGHLEISSAGVVSVNGVEKGKIRVVDFEDPSVLVPAGSSLFKAKEGAAANEASGTTVLQGKIEGSNVSVVLCLTQLIEISREYQAYQKVINNQSKLDQEAASSIGRVS